MRMIFSQAAADIHALTAFFLGEVEACIQSQVNELVGLAKASLQKRTSPKSFLRIAERVFRETARELPKQVLASLCAVRVR